MLIDLTNNIKILFMNVVASRDDLVFLISSNALNNIIGRSDKALIEFQSGHVGKCIGSTHDELWRKLGNWLKKRS